MRRKLRNGFTRLLKVNMKKCNIPKTLFVSHVAVKGVFLGRYSVIRVVIPERTN
jgi:hypothetical protein